MAREHSRRRRSTPHGAELHRASERKSRLAWTPEQAKQKAEQGRQWRARPEVREHRRQLYLVKMAIPGNREHQTEKFQRWYAANKERQAANGRRWKYNVSPEQWEAMLAAQGGGCAICGSPDQLHLDHDHVCCPEKSSCGECVRGIICRTCNHALGNAGDSPPRLRAMAEYLERTRISRVSDVLRRNGYTIPRAWSEVSEVLGRGV